MELILLIGVLHVALHQVAELIKFESAVSICIDLIDHVLELLVSRILAELPHGLAQLGDCDRAIAICIEQGKCFLHFSFFDCNGCHCFLLVDLSLYGSDLSKLQLFKTYKKQK